MVPSTKSCHRLLLVPITCMFAIFFVWSAKTDIDKKESKLSAIFTRLRRPLDIFLFDYEGNETTDGYAVYTNDVQDDGVDEAFLREREKVYSKRQLLVEETCKKLGPNVTYRSLKNVPLRRLRWLNARHLIMCVNAKVGTSSWSHYLIDVAKPGLSSKMRDMHPAAVRYLVPPFSRKSPESLNLINEYKKIMIVRHPFARVVSAYLNKIVGGRGHWFRLSRKIIKKYRPQSSSLTSEISSFEEFVKYLVEDIPINDDIQRKYHNTQDIHWMPFYANCAPCNIHYDAILNMESIGDDTRLCPGNSPWRSTRDTASISKCLGTASIHTSKKHNLQMQTATVTVHSVAIVLVEN
ncbi:carbohydrate sulfotransferase 8-like isoform X2 [Portunus trituberculatus]|uniref:carbohydrate sulfotransferase 8-like isoform X2 n=1 Tax=Portunus trituberculatus TaxID=210409 RepID=UPI001E1D06EA|nr:carbohydrate sulfotransferase 8-like isoform X2 [Portunus trituberculatus]